MMIMMRPYKLPTHTSQVLTALRASDDFMNNVMLLRATGASINQLSAATHHLRKRHAIDCIIEPDGKAWWYALPPELDNRSKHVDERTPEFRPRKKRIVTKKGKS